MHVPVPIRHAVLLGRPRLGMLDHQPDHVAGDAVGILAALADPRRGQSLDIGHRLIARFPDASADAAVAAAPAPW